jgi:2-hydroxychromene-2-carboxylate isomerase
VQRLEYWFDFSCPYAYLGSTQVEKIAARTGAELDPRPMLLGGVFRARETPQKLFATLGEAKARHNANDMARFASLFGVPLTMPAAHPIRTVDALRSLLAVGPPFMPLAHRFFKAYWVDGIDLSTKDGVASVLQAAGHDPEAIWAKAQSDAIKAELKTRTDLAIEKGVFGAPALFVGEQMFFGQDRLDFVEEALGAKATPLATPPGPPKFPVDLWFDYSSPFAYLGWHEAERRLGEVIRPQPMLLGGIFKEVGQVNVPFFAQNEAKQRYTQEDITRHAARLGLVYRWPSTFPMNTVLALRVTLAAKAHLERRGRALIAAFFRAFWADDRDLSKPEVVAEIASANGYDGPALVEAAGAQPIKDLLRTQTNDAVTAGVFGAPTLIVHHDRGRSLYWGSDRVELASLAAAGLATIY